MQLPKLSHNHTGPLGRAHLMCLSALRRHRKCLPCMEIIVFGRTNSDKSAGLISRRMLRHLSGSRRRMGSRFSSLRTYSRDAVELVMSISICHNWLWSATFTLLSFHLIPLWPLTSPTLIVEVLLGDTWSGYIWMDASRPPLQGRPARHGPRQGSPSLMMRKGPDLSGRPINLLDSLGSLWRSSAS